MTVESFINSWIFPALCFGYLIGFFWIGIKTGWIETPKKTRQRKWREADAALTAQEEYDALSPEGKLLQKLTDKQTQTEANTSAIYRMMMGGAIGYLVFYFWPF